MRGLLIANADDADAGFIGGRFRELGCAFTECHRERPQEWPGLDGIDLVLMLGSEWSVYWQHVAEPVAAEVALVRAAQGAGRPQFGICFGNQVMAHALGGTVERARRAEIGWCEVVTDEPLHIQPGPWMQWHSDVVTVPAAATELARSEVGPQAWRLGRSLAVQFHPEATETMLHRWTSLGRQALLDEGIEPERLMEETRTNVALSAQHATELVDWFCAEVAAVPV